MKVMIAAAAAALSLVGMNASALTVECSTLNVSPSAAGYYVEIKASGLDYVANLSHVDADGKDTFAPENYEVKLIFDGQRLVNASGAGFTMDFLTPYDDGQDYSRGDFSLKASLSTGRTISLKSNSLMCQVLQ